MKKKNEFYLNIMARKKKLNFKMHFNFGSMSEKKARIVLKRSYTNIFITLMDLNDQVVICKSSGSSGIKGSKRAKNSPQAIEKIVASLHAYLKLYQIQSVDIILKMRKNVYFHYLLKELAYASFLL